MSDEAEVTATRQRIVETARAMLDGRLSFIEGARRMSRLRLDADLPEFDPDMIRFVAILRPTRSLSATSGNTGSRRPWPSCSPRSSGRSNGRATPAGPHASR